MHAIVCLCNVVGLVFLLGVRSNMSSLCIIGILRHTARYDATARHTPCICCFPSVRWHFSLSAPVPAVAAVNADATADAAAVCCHSHSRCFDVSLCSFANLLPFAYNMSLPRSVYPVSLLPRVLLSQMPHARAFSMVAVHGRE